MAYQNTERELKMLLTKEQYEALKSHLKWDECFEQTNTYYDDDQQSLKQAGCALRIRQTGGKQIVTVKKPKDAITKEEYEFETKSDSMENLNEQEKEQIASHVSLAGPVHPTARFHTLRCIHSYDKGDLCLDKTQFPETTDYELEYEYSQDHDGISFLNDLLAPFGLQYEKNGPSKLARAMMYAKH